MLWCLDRATCEDNGADRVRVEVAHDALQSVPVLRVRVGIRLAQHGHSVFEVDASAGGPQRFREERLVQASASGGERGALVHES